MITKLGLYLNEIIICCCDEFCAGEFSASCFSMSFPRFFEKLTGAFKLAVNVFFFLLLFFDLKLQFVNFFVQGHDLTVQGFDMLRTENIQ